MEPAFQIDQSFAPNVREITVDDRSEVSAFLSRDTSSNLFLIAWLENYGVFAPGRPDLFQWNALFDQHRLIGVCLTINERLTLFSVEHPEFASYFANHFRKAPFVLEHIVSEAHAVKAFWQAYESKSGPARLHREQQFMRLDRLTFNANPLTQAGTGLRLATAQDLDAVFLASAAMHAEETLDDPLERDATLFRRHIEQRINSGRTFVWFEGRRLLFKADISSKCTEGVQISGVYTPPALRGNGYGTQGVQRLCEILFSQGYPVMTLYVNSDNAVAQALYRKIGFKPHAPYHTVFIR